MNLDVNTQFLLTVYVEAILGLLLAVCLSAEHRHHRRCVVGFAHFLRAASVTLFGL